MRTALMITAAFALLSVGFNPASAQKIDKNGRCHDKAGKFAKDEVCKGAIGGSAMSAGPAMSAAPTGYKLDAKGNCHDAKGKMAKKTMCKA